MSKKCLVLVSGGIDSTTCLLHMKNLGYEVSCLHIDYGQVTAEAERRSISAIFKNLGIPDALELRFHDIGSYGSGTLAGQETSDALFEFRNLLLISIASVVASSIDADSIGLGLISCSSPEYPDCSHSFLSSANAILKFGNKPIVVNAPLADLSKKEVVSMALSMQVPLELTFSCNSNGLMHCMDCSSCHERYSAFHSMSHLDTSLATSRHPNNAIPELPSP